MDFDLHASTYEKEVAEAVAFAGQKQDFYTQVKAERLLEIFRARYNDLSRIRVLDVGCGVGLTDEAIKERIQNLTGVDVSESSLAKAHKRNPQVSYVHYEGDVLPFADDSFHALFAICVWHHVPRPKWLAFAREIWRVLKPRGIAVIFEHNPWNPLTRYVVSRIPFDENAELLREALCKRLLREAGFVCIRGEYLLFLPVASKFVRRLEHGLFRRVPLGAQYGVIGSKLP
jgi:SAM-dependent methyltransferase